VSLSWHLELELRGIGKLISELWQDCRGLKSHHVGIWMRGLLMNENRHYNNSCRGADMKLVGGIWKVSGGVLISNDKFVST